MNIVQFRKQRNLVMLEQTVKFSFFPIAFHIVSSVLKIRNGDIRDLMVLRAGDVCKSSIFWGFYVAEFYANFLGVKSFTDCVILCSHDPDCTSANYVAEKRGRSSVKVCLLSRYNTNLFSQLARIPKFEALYILLRCEGFTRRPYLYKPPNSLDFQTCGVGAFEQGDFAATSGSRVARIVGGATATPFSQPWIGQIIKQGTNQCGVSLIGRNDGAKETVWAISAAHCFRKRHDYGVAVYKYSLIFGLHDLRFATPHIVHRYVEKVFIHEEFDSKNVDLVLIKMEMSIEFNDFVRPVCLPPSRAKVKEPPNVPCTVCGYGVCIDKSTKSSTVLKCLMTKIQQEGPETENFLIWNRQSSTYSVSWAIRYKGPHSGDSGGPATCKNDGKSYLFGLISAKATAKSKFDFSIAIYLHVPIFVDWISKMMVKEDERLLIEQRQQEVPLSKPKLKSKVCWPRSFPKGCMTRI